MPWILRATCNFVSSGSNSCRALHMESGGGIAKRGYVSLGDYPDACRAVSFKMLTLARGRFHIYFC